MTARSRSRAARSTRPARPRTKASAQRRTKARRQTKAQRRAKRLKRAWERLRRLAKRHPRASLVVGLLLAVVLNFLVQIVRKPAEIAAFLNAGHAKSPAETWEAYGSSFRAYATPVTSAYFLAALAQVESAGNPWATPEWRFKLSGSPTRIYSPASTAVGLMQFTDGTFKGASELCVRDGQVRHAGAWLDWDSCWFNWTYTRLSADDSIELAAAHLTYHVSQLVGGRARQLRQRNPRLLEELAGLTHLCGLEVARRQLRAGMKGTRSVRCGSHSAGLYLRKLRKLERVFRSLDTRS